MRRGLVLGLTLALVLAVAAEWIGHRSARAGEALWPGAAGVYALYGLGGCVALVAIAKGLGWLGLTRDEPDEPAVAEAARSDPEGHA